MDYKKDIMLDENSLDLEILDQPALMMEYSQACSQAHLDMELEKQKLDLTKSKLDYNVRLEPTEYGIDSKMKITEAVILGAIQQQDIYIKANEKYLKAKYDYEVMKGAVSAVEQRKTALELLVKLHGQQYFAGPAVARDIYKERQKRVVKTNAGVSAKMQRKNHE